MWAQVYNSIDVEGNWWCKVIPKGTVASDLYRSLKYAPDYRYAIAGLEVDKFRTYSELLQETDLKPFDGLVLSEATWKAIKAPEGFVAFAPGYVWRPSRQFGCGSRIFTYVAEDFDETPEGFHYT